MIHVFQKDDGTANWQSPQQDGGYDEAILRGLINGRTNFPASSSDALSGVNGVYGQLYTLTTTNPSGQSLSLATGPGADTRIRFRLEDIRYYRVTSLWDMSSGNPRGCGASGDAAGCGSPYYDSIVNTSKNNRFNCGRPILTDDERHHILHIFMAENPGVASTPLDNFGNTTSHYSTGGVAGGIPAPFLTTRGLYWMVYHFPYGSLQDSSTAPQVQLGLHYAEFIMSHELGHCLGLPHTFDTPLDCSLWPGGPSMPTKGTTNNLMDYPPMGWMPKVSLSACQVGRMHYFLEHGGGVALNVRPSSSSMDDLLVEDYCQQDPNQSIIIPASTTQIWEAAHNLTGTSLVIEDKATLIIRCRVGFAGPRVDIKLGQQARLILENGTLGNFATSERNECPQDVEVHIGGPGGLVEVQQSGGFTSRHLTVVFEGDVTFHVPPAVMVLLDGAQLRTEAPSYLCLEPTTLLKYQDAATFTINPATMLGVHPAALVPTGLNCTTDLCEVLAAGQLSSNLPPRTTLCAGQPLILTALFQHSDPNTTIIWRRNSIVVPAASPDDPRVYTDSPTQDTDYEAEISWPGTNCPSRILHYQQLVQPEPGISLLNSSLSLCTGPGMPGYYNSTYLNLNAPTLIGQIYNPNDPVNQGGTVAWESDAFVTSTGYFNLAAAQAKGRLPYVLRLCRAQPGTVCKTCAEIKLSLTPATAFSLSNATPDPACPGTRVTLLAQGLDRTSYTWQPGNLSGSSVTVAPNVTTTYTVTGTGFERCSTVHYVTVTVKPPTCAECSEIYQSMDPALPASFTFLNGRTYMFSGNTTLSNGNFMVEDGARLLFAGGVTLTVGNMAQLQLQGGTLTAACSEMWGGIAVAASSRGVVSVSGSGSFTAPCEISHARNGLMVYSNSNTIGFQPTLDLNNVSFLHNGQSLHVTNSYPKVAFGGRVTNCTFDSDPQLMRAPWQYVSAQNQHVTLRHVSLSGNCAGLTVNSCTLDHALYAFWTPTGAPFTAIDNQLRNFYIAALYSHTNFSANLRFNRNTLTYPPAANGLQTADGPQLREAYEELVQLEGPTAKLRHFVCVGIYGPTLTGSPTTLLPLYDNQFLGQNYLSSSQSISYQRFISYEPYPQYGVVTGGVTMQRNTFRNLTLGCQSASTQQGGLIVDNSFQDCYQALNFHNELAPGSTGLGNATVSCNTFTRTPSMSGINYGIFRDACQRQFSGPCDQIDLSSQVNGSPLLLKNLFADSRPSVAIYDYNRFWHVWNGVDDGYTTNLMTYSTFAPIAPTIVGGPQASNGNRAVITTSDATPFNSSHDCRSEGFTGGNGLLARATTTGVVGSTSSGGRLIYLAQNVPNPCTSTATVTYRTPATTEPVTLVVRHYISGQVLHRQAVAAGEHTTELDLRSLPPGPYHYTLEVAGRPMAHRNLLLQ